MPERSEVGMKGSIVPVGLLKCLKKKKFQKEKHENTAHKILL